MTSACGEEVVAVGARAPGSNQLARSGASRGGPAPPSLTCARARPDAEGAAGDRHVRGAAAAMLGLSAGRAVRVRVCARGRTGSRGGGAGGGTGEGRKSREVSRSLRERSRLRDGGAALGVLGNGNGGPGGGDPGTSLLPAIVPRATRGAGRGWAPRGSVTGSAPLPPPAPALPRLTSPQLTSPHAVPTPPRLSRGVQAAASCPGPRPTAHSPLLPPHRRCPSLRAPPAGGAGLADSVAGAVPGRATPDVSPDCPPLPCRVACWTGRPTSRS